MRLEVDSGGYDSAADALEGGNLALAGGYASLTGKLGGYSAMAGDDTSSEDFVRNYDAAAADTVAAFAEHSTYRQDWWERLSRTAEYIAVTTFGSTTDAMFAASRVRAIHARVHGTLPSGAAYDAEDPQLLGWVHCCLVASFLEVVTRGGLPLSGAEQDAYVAEVIAAGGDAARALVHVKEAFAEQGDAPAVPAAKLAALTQMEVGNKLTATQAKQVLGEMIAAGAFLMQGFDIVALPLLQGKGD